MGLGQRLLVYFGLLTIGACLGLLSVAAQIGISGWLTRAGLIPNPCGHGCPEGWTVSLIGPFAIAIAAAVGLFSAMRPRYAVWTFLLTLVYAAALRWSVYGVQYAAVAALFGLWAFAAGQMAARLVARA